MQPDGNYTTGYNTVIIKTGTEGDHGTAAGAGGSGGNLTLTYSSDNFLINLNRNARYNQKAIRHSTLLTSEGKTGLPGKDGRSYIGLHEAGAAVITGAPTPAPHQNQQSGQLNLNSANKNQAY